MVSLPRFFSANTGNGEVLTPPSPPIRSSNHGTVATDMSIRDGSQPTALGIPGSLKTVFNTSEPRASIVLDDFMDEIPAEYLPGSLLSSNATIGRRSRLDDSAGEGLRRNVLVRNAMLSSLERERRQLSQEMLVPGPIFSTPAGYESSAAAVSEQEAQFFEDLLSELSGAESFDASCIETEGTVESNDARPSIGASPKPLDDEEDFVDLESDLPSAPTLEQLTPSSHTGSPHEGAAAMARLEAEFVGRSVSAMVDSGSSACSARPEGDDSGFAETASHPTSIASCCTGYPNVCPYPATSSFVGGSSEELPALIDDTDSDLDDDEDEVEDRVPPEAESSRAAHNIALGSEACALLSLDADATLSRPRSPVTSPVHSTFIDYNTFRDPLSPEPSRPTSPMSSASSKGDAEATSPLLLPSDNIPLPSLAELSLQLPAATGTEFLARPGRARAGAWFEHKLDAPTAASTSADRMRWTTAPTSFFRSNPAAPSSTLADYQALRLGIDHTHGSYASVPANHSTEHSVVVHWSR